MNQTPADRGFTSTYRLQLHAGFTFSDAAARVGYLRDLGVSHLYLSPILTAVPGSTHGYDVLDHRAINPELGGREGFEQLAAEAHAAGLGIIVDVVPNHMALVSPQWTNAPFWQVLRDGPTAATAHWFDIDISEGPVALPILGSPLPEVLAAGEITLDVGRKDEGPAAGAPVLRYFDQVFPLNPASTRLLAETVDEDSDASSLEVTQELLEAQHYRLGYWRDRDRLLNYRRFFEVDSLIGVRVEESDVFEQTHRLLLDLHHAGLIDGFRIDHPDGLADPEGYLADLSRQVRPGTPVWVEKILHGAERLPVGWPVSGTTGYDATAVLLEALTPDAPEVTDTLDQTWSTALGEDAARTYADAEHRAKTEAVDRLLGPEMRRLVRAARLALPQLSAHEARAAVRALLVSTQAYRIYLRFGATSDPGVPEQLQALVGRAVAQQPDLTEAIEALGRVLEQPELAGHDPIAARDLAVRFQQTSGPVMAKGIEDTAFYRWHRLIARNEVGADPAAPVGAAGVAALHAWAQNQAEHWPIGMTTTSTHDTKRSEDVRARLLALAAHPRLWRELSESTGRAAVEAGVDPATAHLIWQTVAGTHPISAERLTEYLTKANREAKEHTTWIEVDEEYENAVHTLARTVLDGPIGARIAEVVGDLDGDLDGEIHADIRAVTLAQKVLVLTLPGLPDTYQGNEMLDLSLVDPDNRRPVDDTGRERAWQQWHDAATRDDQRLPDDLSAAKLAVTATVLRLRRDHPETFGGGYTPVPVRAGAVGFARHDHTGTARLVVVVRGAGGPTGSQPVTATFPPGSWREVFTGAVVVGEAPVEVVTDQPVGVFMAVQERVR